jgi:hypothetical protein
MQELRSLKIDLFLHQQGLDTTTPAGKMVFQGAKSKRGQKRNKMIEVPWRKTPSTRRREVLVPDTGATEVRPIRSESRALSIGFQI